MKNCKNKKCKQQNPQSLNNFTKNSKTKDGLKIWCKNCTKQYEKEYYMDMQNKYTRKKYKKDYDKKYYDVNFLRYREKQLLRLYGITLQQYNQMLAEQNCKCAVCNKNELEVGTLCVDHDHENGKIRNLVCTPCNTALGLLKEDVEILDRAKLYLVKWKNK